MNTKYTYLYIPIIIILICNIIWPPSQLLITDELSYYFQANNWLGGNINNTIVDAVSGTTYTLIEGHYPPGTSFILSILMWINGSILYFGGLIYLLCSILVMYKCLRKLDIPIIALSVIYLFLPLIFIMRTTMSEMPSLLLVSIGIYLYYNNKQKSYLWLAFITGLSVAFRETNIILLAPLAFYISRNYFYSILIFLLGLSFRLIGYYILTNNPLLLKEGYPFGIEFLPDTILIYSVVLLVLLPLSPLWFTKVPRSHIRPFALGLLSFLSLHLVYGYVAHVYSGYTNGILLNGRFWIPALPLFVIAMGYYLKDRLWVKKYWVAVCILTLMAITSLGIHYKSYSKQIEYSKFSEALKSIEEDQITFIDMDSRTPIFRYIYKFVNDRKWSDINLVNDDYHANQAFTRFGKIHVAIISSGATIAQSNRNSKFNTILNKLKSKYTVTNIREVCPGSNSCLNIYEVTRR